MSRNELDGSMRLLAKPALEEAVGGLRPHFGVALLLSLPQHTSSTYSDKASYKLVLFYLLL